MWKILLRSSFNYRLFRATVDFKSNFTWKFRMCCENCRNLDLLAWNAVPWRRIRENVQVETERRINQTNVAPETTIIADRPPDVHPTRTIADRPLQDARRITTAVETENMCFQFIWTHRINDFHSLTPLKLLTNMYWLTGSKYVI